MNPKQSNTQEGIYALNSGEAMTGKESYLVKLSRKDADTPEILLPTSNADECSFVVEDGGLIDANSDVRPLQADRNIFLVAKDAIQAGERVELADVSTAADKGKVRALRATASGGPTVFSPGICDKDAGAGALVRVRPDPRLVTIAAVATLAVAGAVLAIPVTHRIVNKTTTGAEALTLADGIVGQRLQISLVTDGGDGTLTPATSTNWATAVLADAKDTLNLLYVDDTVGWIVEGATGAAAPPVLT
jgi:hypothetical protein